MNTISKVLLLVAVCALAACATVTPERLEVALSAPVVAAPTPSSATAPEPVVDEAPPRSVISAHLENAAAIAAAAGDGPGQNCWKTMQAWVDTLPLGHQVEVVDPVLPPATGPAGVIEVARIKAKVVQARVAAAKGRVAQLRAIIDAGVPDGVVTACAIVMYDARALAVKILGAIGLPTVGVLP